MNEVELAVGKKTGSANAAEDVAGTAFYAAAILDRAFAFQGGLAFFNDQYLKVRVLGEIIGGKKPGRSAADDDDVVERI